MGYHLRDVGPRMHAGAVKASSDEGGAPSDGEVVHLAGHGGRRRRERLPGRLDPGGGRRHGGTGRGRRRHPGVASTAGDGRAVRCRGGVADPRDVRRRRPHVAGSGDRSGRGAAPVERRGGDTGRPVRRPIRARYPPRGGARPAVGAAAGRRTPLVQHGAGVPVARAGSCRRRRPLTAMARAHVDRGRDGRGGADDPLGA